MKTLNGGTVKTNLIYNTQSYGDKYAASADFQANNIKLSVSASNEVHSQMHSSGESDTRYYGSSTVTANASIGIIKNNVNFSLYSSCVMTSDKSATIALRTGNANTSSTFINTATVLASGVSPLTINRTERGTIVIGISCNVVGVSQALKDPGNKSATNAVNITKIYLI